MVRVNALIRVQPGFDALVKRGTWGMLMFVLELSWSILLSKGLPPVALQLEITFICKDAILKTFFLGNC